LELVIGINSGRVDITAFLQYATSQQHYWLICCLWKRSLCLMWILWINLLILCI